MKYLIRFYLILFFLPFGSGLHAQEMDYVIDESFNTGLFYSMGAIADLLLHDDGKVMVSGGFNGTAEASNSSLIDPFGNILYNGITSWIISSPKNFHYQQKYLKCGISNIFINYMYGGADNSFKFEFKKSAYNGFLGNNVLDAIVEPDDNILAAGRFFTDSMDISPETIRQLCRVDSTGAPDPDFPMLHCAEPMDAYIRDMETLSDGSIIITGLFTEIGGYVYNQVGKLNPDFSVDTTFVNSMAPGGEGGFIYIDSQDRIWLQMHSSNLIGEPPIWGSTIIRLLPDGNVDPDFVRPDLFKPYNLPLPGTMTDIVEMPDGKFIITGNFTKVNDIDRQCIAMIEEDGTLVEGVFENIGPDEAIWGPANNNPVISRIRLLDDGKLLIGGGFSSFGGEPYSCLVRLQPQPVNTTNEEGRGKLRLWPNPSGSGLRPVVQVALPDHNERIIRIDISDLQGRMVQSKSPNQSMDYKIDIQDLQPGIYLVKAASEKGVYTQKLVVQ